MKYKVIKNFTDRHNKTKYRVNDVVEFTEKRAEEILSVGKLIEKVEEVQLTTSQVVEVVEEIKDVEKTEVAEPVKKKKSKKK